LFKYEGNNITEVTIHSSFF